MGGLLPGFVGRLILFFGRGMPGSTQLYLCLLPRCRTKTNHLKAVFFFCFLQGQRQESSRPPFTIPMYFFFYFFTTQRGTLIRLMSLWEQGVFVCFLNETIFIIFEAAAEDVTLMQESYGQNISHNLKLFVKTICHIA